MIEQMLQAVAVILVSTGGAAAIIWKLSGFLGRVWAERLMVQERARHDQEIEQLKSRLRLDTETQLEEVRRLLDLARDVQLRHHNDKLTIYRSAIDMIAEIIHQLEEVATGRRPAPDQDAIRRFAIQRLQAYGYLAMLAPQTVMDSFDAMIDTLVEVIHENREVTWQEVRQLSLGVLNAVRADLGIDGDEIAYRGWR